MRSDPLITRPDNPDALGQPTRAHKMANRLLGELFTPVDIAPLVVFRVFFGAMMLSHVIKLAKDRWISFFYVEPIFHLTYPRFGWVEPWPGNGMSLHFAVLGIDAVGIMAGLFYRLSAAVFAVGFTYVFLLEKGLYQNHYHLICLISGIMVFVSAHRRRPPIRPVKQWHGFGKLLCAKS